MKFQLDINFHYKRNINMVLIFIIILDFFINIIYLNIISCGLIFIIMFFNLF